MEYNKYSIPLHGYKKMVKNWCGRKLGKMHFQLFFLHWKLRYMVDDGKSFYYLHRKTNKGFGK